MRGGDNWGTGTYEHHPLGNVIGLHKRILVEPQLLWLNHSLKGLQELCESVARKRKKNTHTNQFISHGADTSQRKALV